MPLSFNSLIYILYFPNDREKGWNGFIYLKQLIFSLLVNLVRQAHFQTAFVDKTSLTSDHCKCLQDAASQLLMR